MAVRITAVKPKVLPTELIAAHAAMESFTWINEQTQQTGETPREAMYDWIVNKKGRAYVKNANGDSVFIFGALTPTGTPYIRTAEGGKWTDLLIGLEMSSLPPGAK